MGAKKMTEMPPKHLCQKNLYVVFPLRTFVDTSHFTLIVIVVLASSGNKITLIAWSEGLLKYASYRAVVEELTGEDIYQCTS